MDASGASWKRWCTAAVCALSTIAELRARIQVAWDTLQQQPINATFGRWRARLQKVVDQRGGHIEQFYK